jgi:PASTA domain
MRGYAVGSVFLVLIAAVVTACGDGSDGSAAAQFSVPNVVGDTQSVATTAITGAGLTVGTVTQASSATVASGSVVSQAPAAGTSAASGSSVALVVSSGLAPVSVPNVVGDTQAAATTAITGAGLKVGTLTQATSSTIPKGDVVSENPVAGMNVESGSAVALVISTGPVTHTVGGTLIGLAPSASVHVLNGADSEAISANGSFTLPTGVVNGGTYSVTVGTPTSTQACAVQNASGTIASANVTNVVVYCTYTVNAATLKTTFTSVGVEFNDVASGVNYPYDFVSADTFDGVSAISSTITINYAGTIVPDQTTGTYAVTTANAIPSFTDNSPGLGGIEGANGNAIVSAEGMASGTQPQIYVAVLPDTNATTDSVNGNYTAVTISAALSTGDIEASEGNLTLTNGAFSGTLTSNTAGTITTGNQNKGQFTVASGIVTQPGTGAGAVSADGDLIVKADTNPGDDPAIYVWVRQGSGVTPATFEGVYSVTQYGGLSVTTTFGEAITLFAYGNGTYGINFTKNAQGTITTNNTNSGTYTMAADGTLTLTDSDGKVYNGAISADGNALALGSVTSGLSPAIFVGVRQ